MFSLASIVTSPRIAQQVTVARSTGVFGQGGFRVTSTQNIVMAGVLAPADDETLKMLPEADRITGSLIFLTDQTIYETSQARSGLSDQIIAPISTDDGDYRVQAVGPWGAYGFNVAVLVRMKGA